MLGDRILLEQCEGESIGGVGGGGTESRGERERDVQIEICLLGRVSKQPLGGNQHRLLICFTRAEDNLIYSAGCERATGVTATFSHFRGDIEMKTEKTLI